MKKLCWAAFVCLLFSTTVNAGSIPIVFKLRDGLDPGEVYATFYNCINNASSITGTYNSDSGQKNLNTSQSFSMQELTGKTSIATGVPKGVPAVLISDFKSGRIYISYKNELQSFGCTQPSTEPSSQDKNLGTRYQPMELDIENGVINTNLTYIDYAAIALSLTVKNATSNITNNPLLTTVSSETLTDILGKTTITDYSTVRPSSADRLPNESFARVLSPTSADMCKKFNDWTHYLKTTLYQSTTVNNKPIKIKGLFGGVGAQPANAGGLATNPKARNQTQSYDYHVVFDANGDATMTAQAGSGDGTVAGVGTNVGVGVGQVDVTITFAALNASTGIYGNNPAYTIAGIGTTSGVENDYYGWVVGDLLAGLSWGLPGSTVKFNSTSAQNVEIGNMHSVEWYGGIWPNGTANSVPLSPVGKGKIYGKAQPANPTDYHTYAAGLTGITGAYGFGLQDRSGQTLINFSRSSQANAYLEVGLDTENKSVVAASTSQAPGISITIDEFVPKEPTSSEIKESFNQDNFTTYSSLCSFNATINSNGGCATFMIDSHEIPTGSISGLTLMKFYSSNGTSKAYKNYASSGAQFNDGSWWITDLSGNHLSSSDKVTYGTHYYIHFVIKDNGEYDENSVLGKITDPVALGSVFSTGGCVMAPHSEMRYEFILLLVLALIKLFTIKKLNAK